MLRSAWKLVPGAALAVCTVALAASEVSGVRTGFGARETPAPRIIALAPHLTEIAFAAGAGRHLAAVVRYSDHPPAAARLPQVGDAARIDIERVLALKPDLILAWQSGNPAHDLHRLRALGLKLFVSEPQRLADIPRLLREIGELAGTGAIADIAARELEHELESLRVRYSARARVRVFYEIWHRPLLTVSGAHMISDIIGLCGGENVFADARVLTPSVSYESVLARRPDVIIGGSSATRAEAFAAAWQRAPAKRLRAIPVRYIDPDLIQRQSPRIAQGARAACEALEAVRQAQLRIRPHER